jgi:agmatine deiminase
LSRRRLLTIGGLGAAAVVAGGAGAAAMVRRASTATQFVVPVDTTEHTRTWMAWPDSSQIWGRQLKGAQDNIALVAKTIAKYEPVVMCANRASVSNAQAACGSSVTVIGTIPVDDCWVRDMGPIFRTDGGGRLDVVGTNFNGWGGKQTHANDALVASRIAAHVGVPFTAASFVGEGGAIETDGAGTLMATESSLVNANRNPGKTRDHIAAAMCAAYGASSVIWFTGVKGRDITDDHVDATSRFLSPGRGVVQMPWPTDTDVWSRDARQQYRVLSTSRTSAGRVIEVGQIQGPDYAKIRSRSVDFVGSYANYYVCNGAVIAAQFGDRAADAAAKESLAALFPGRVIEQLNIDHLGAGGGGIHCVTQQQPRGRPQ